jgi:hypothetical protein
MTAVNNNFGALSHVISSKTVKFAQNFFFNSDLFLCVFKNFSHT